jgi:Pyruvate phosphate dikinase, AMP/ATP-binding domain
VSEKGSSWEPWHRRYQRLMPHRIHEILLVSSAYDAFVLEEDGSLSDRLFSGYSELSLSSAPRLTHAPSAERALSLLDTQRFDLVITVLRIGDADADQLASRVKAIDPEVPVVLLIFDEAELTHLPDEQLPASLDLVFQWTGSERTLIAAIKLVEDGLNAEHDTELAGVQLLLVVEDRVRTYSSFLGLLYHEILEQSGSLVAEAHNDFHRSLRMRSRPKILLARTFEEAEAIYTRFRPFVSSLLTDVRIPRNGTSAPRGGLELAKAIRENNPYLPILVQSNEPHQGSATQLGGWFVDKNSPQFRSHVRRFLTEALGFGPFVFRLPDRTEVGKASDVYEMEVRLAEVPAAAIAYHASHDHFSAWLRARNLADVAESIGAYSLDDFEDVETMRQLLVSVLRDARVAEQEGVITDLYSRDTGPDNRFVRVGRGSIGGKGRGIAFFSSEIVRHGLLDKYPELQIRIPKTVVLGTSAFDRLMDDVDLEEFIDDPKGDAAITTAVMGGRLSDPVRADLRQAFDNLSGPLAVRSSSLLEDSRFQPFAGVYATYMLPNVHPDPDVRFLEMLRGIKCVYASTFWRDAQTYVAGTPHDSDDQKMAVVIQQIIGSRFGDRYYPVMSGVAQSYNDYPIAPQRAEDGVAHVAIGLGHTVVGGGIALRFSPGAPMSLPQFPDAESFVDGSQRQLLALDLSRPLLAWSDGPEASLVRCDLKQAESDGVLGLVGSVFCPGDDVIREGLHQRGPRLVTFNSILKYNALPLAAALRDILAVLQQGMGEEVEVEFALDVPESDPKTMTLSGGARLYVLQVRPMSAPEQRQLLRNLDEVSDDHLLARTDVALGHGSHESIRDVVWVEADRLGSVTARARVAAVAALDEELRAAGRPYLLVGPGRWGSSDPTLGVGVRWADIAGARVIVETPIGARRVEPSQGTHFFRNITAARVGYVTIRSTDTSWLDKTRLEAAWLDSGRRTTTADEAVRHIRFDEPLGVHLDGRRGVAVIVTRAALLR